MPSPVGHVFGGVALYFAVTPTQRQSRTLLAVMVLSSIAPDFDFAPGIFVGNPSASHHGVSHSLGAAVLFAAAVFTLFRCYQPSISALASVLAGLAYAFHIILDLINVNEGTRGVPILWPLTGHQFGFNFHLFGHFHHDGFAEGIWSVVRWDNLHAVGRELLVTGTPLLFLVWRGRTKRLTSNNLSA